MSDTPVTPSQPIKDIAGKNYTFSFGKYRNRKVWEVLEGNPASNFAGDPAWLLQNNGRLFNLSERLRKEAADRVGSSK